MHAGCGPPWAPREVRHLSSTSHPPTTPKKVSPVPKGGLPSLAQQRKFFDELKAVLDIEAPDDWYNTTMDSVIKAGGKTLIRKYYDGSLMKLLATMYPDHEWLEWKFIRTPQNWWADLNNQRRYITWFEKVVGIKSKEDWYTIHAQKLESHHGTTMIRHIYNGSPLTMLRAIYPEYDWLPWKFLYVSSRFWDIKNYHRKYFDWLLLDLGLSQVPDDLDKVTVDQVIKRKGGQLLATYYGNDLRRALRENYPELGWADKPLTPHSRATNTLPLHSTSMLAHQRMIFDAMKPVLKIDNPEDWYNVTSKAAFQAGGQAVIRTHYDSSLTRALMSIYPEHEWHEWKFHRGPHGWWSSFENQHRYIQWLEKQVGITSLAQWYSIPQSILKNNHGSTLLKRFNGSVKRLVAAIYPAHEWVSWKFKKSQSF